MFIELRYKNIPFGLSSYKVIHARKPIAVTPGEPAGIGTEITIKAWRNRSCPPFFLIDDVERVYSRAKETELEVPIEVIKTPSQTLDCFHNALPILPHKFPVHCEAGRPVDDNAQSITKAIKIAVDYAREGVVSALVTNPNRRNKEGK